MSKAQAESSKNSLFRAASSRVEQRQSVSSSVSLFGEKPETLLRLGAASVCFEQRQTSQPSDVYRTGASYCTEARTSKKGLEIFGDFF